MSAPGSFATDVADLACRFMSAFARKRQTSYVAAKCRNVPILLQKSAILVVGLPLRPLEADSDYSFSHWTLVGV